MWLEDSSKVLLNETVVMNFLQHYTWRVSYNMSKTDRTKIIESRRSYFKKKQRKDLAN